MFTRNNERCQKSKTFEATNKRMIILSRSETENRVFGVKNNRNIMHTEGARDSEKRSVRNMQAILIKKIPNRGVRNMQECYIRSASSAI